MKTNLKLKINIPDRKNLYITQDDADCAKYYYMPVIGDFYIKRIKMICQLIKQRGDSVLDIGHGSGILFYELKDRFNNLNGMDLRSDANLVRRALGQEGIEVKLINGNLFNLPYKDASFECIIAMSVLEHISELKQPLAEIRRVLKKDGDFICGFPAKNIFMHHAFKLLGFDDDKNHPSSHRYIEGMLKKYFWVGKTMKFPFFLPANFCFYIACRCKKKD
jgi:ubiquinone/menaquinone biosynthesis C-methylase UbiE